MGRGLRKNMTDEPLQLRSVTAMKNAIMALADKNLRSLEHEGTLNAQQIASVAKLLDIIDKLQRMEEPEPPSQQSPADTFGLK